MRTRLLTIFMLTLLALAIVGCASKEEAPVDGATSETAAAEEQTEATTSEEAEATPQEETVPDDAANQSGLDEEIQIGPIGQVRLANGQAIELTEFDKIGKYYIYISGKLNGRSSTVISFTRLSDLKRWESIRFKDQHTFMIITKDNKELRFADSRVYIGSDSPETYTFQTTQEGGFGTESITVRKSDVKEIIIN